MALGAIQIANYITPLIVLIHLTKTLGIEIYGILAFSQGVIAISLIFLDFGYSLSATYKISKFRSNRMYVSRLVGGIMAVQLMIFLICTLTISIYALITEKYSEHRTLILFILIPIFMQGVTPIWFFQGVERMKYFAFSAITSKVIFAILTIYIIKEPSDYKLVPLVSGIGHMIALISAVFFIYKLGYKIKKPTLKITSYSYKISKRFFVSRIAVASYANGAILILGFVAQPAAVAMYSMAEQLYKFMQSALAPAAAAAYPYMSKEKDFSLMFKLIIGVVSIAIIGACTGYFVGPIFIELIFDENWLKSIPVFNIFLFSIVFYAGAIMTGYPLAAIVDRLDIANESVMIGAAIYFFLLALTFIGNQITPIILAYIMMVSEISVLLYRSFLLFPLILKK